MPHGEVRDILPIEEHARRAHRNDGIARRAGRRIVRLPGIRHRVPPRYRPALYLETLYNFGTGAFLALYLLAPVVLKTILDGKTWHLAVLGALFGGSSLLSPVISYAARHVSMRSLVVYPNVFVAAMMVATCLPFGGATFFTIVVGIAYVARAFPRVGEMNLYRVNFPDSHRGAAVGWVKAIAGVSGVMVTVLGYWWLSFRPDLYWVVFASVGALMMGSAVAYARIPMKRRNVFAPSEQLPPHRAFARGVRIFFQDRRFVAFQFGFMLAGTANQLSIVFVAEVLTEKILRGRPTTELVPQFLHGLAFDTLHLTRQTTLTIIVGFVSALLPALFTMASSPFWGRFLDRVNPMMGRAIFNSLQGVAFVLMGYGGVTLQVWPMALGAAVHALSVGGSSINWLTGSLYFAPLEHVSLYNAIHVALTGLRGLIAPLVGAWLYSGYFNLGAHLFWVAAALSAAGTVEMLVQGLTDKGPRAEPVAVPHSSGKASQAA